MPIHRVSLVLCTLLAVGSAVHAAGGSSTTPATPTTPELTPQEEAVVMYNRGLKYRDKAWQLDEDYAAAPSEKLAEKIEKQFDKAAKQFESAVEKHPDFHQAHSSLGYALRRMGSYDASIAAYNRALEIEPDYAEAIEYRAEAYLGLNRLDEAKEAYLQLFRSDRERAGELFDAMQSWVDERKADPAGVDAGVVDSFAGWLEERGQVAEHTAMLYTSAERVW